MIVSIADYSRGNKDYADYLGRLARTGLAGQTDPRMKAGMLKWAAADAYMWSGPFPGDFAFFRIEDARKCASRKTNPIRSVNDSMKEAKIYASSTIFNFPHRLHDVFDRIEVLHGTKCQRTRMREDEIETLLGMMTEEEKATREQAIEKHLESRRRDIRADPTKEWPIRFYMCGNDDTSYTMCFESRKLALNALESLKANPTFENLKNAGFVFTN